MAIASGLCMWAVIIARVYDDDAEYVLPASEVEEIEARRYQALVSAARTQTAGEATFSNQPLQESLT
jgi:hypothetical protein